ncbi:recombinase family protein [Acinetobacter baumannii]|nr:recombinase family protein [Acinetobacter baumannii]
MPRGYKVGYARVSTEEQNLDRQIEAFNKIGLDKIFYEKVQGDKEDKDRPELQKFLSYLEEGDIAYFASFDRLSRKNLRLLNLIDEIKKKGVSVHFIEERIHLNPIIENPFDELNANIFAAFSDFFKKQSKIRQAQGIELAKKDPKKYTGREPILSLTKRKTILKLIMVKGMPYSKVGKKYGVSRTTLWRIVYRDKALNDYRAECIRMKCETDLKNMEVGKLK